MVKIMPAYKDRNNGTWFCKFSYKDFDAVTKQKWKRGFASKKEAQAFERNFLEQMSAGPDILFFNLYVVYLKDMLLRLRHSTMLIKINICETKILPFFRNKRLSEIRAIDIRRWQDALMSDEKGYSMTYLKTIYNQLNSMFKFAQKYYNLRTNPCEQAGSIGSSRAAQMQCWTLDEFLRFREGLADKYQSLVCFDVLYWTGMREGELLALTEGDIDLVKKEISINKSYQRLEKQDIITPPKTKKSRRKVPIPDFLCEELREYRSGPAFDGTKERFFPFTKSYLNYEMKRGCRKTGVKKIRVHDLRHSHVSLLIDRGFDALIIAERVGHENVSTTLNTYAHLFPSKQTELVSSLEDLGAKMKEDEKNRSK